MTTWRKLPPMAVVPERYGQETDAAYNARVYRWRVWAFNEPRPDLWYTPEYEIQNYQRWRNENTKAST